VPIEDVRNLIDILATTAKILEKALANAHLPLIGSVVSPEEQQSQAEFQLNLAAMAAELALTAQEQYALFGGRPASRAMTSRAGALRGGPGGGQGMAGARSGSLRPGASRPRIGPVPRKRSFADSHVLGAAMEVLLDQIYGEDEE
jgi:hypothetical protein